MVSIGASQGVPQHGASVNAMNSSFISLVAMNLTPLITPFSQSIGMILSKTVTFLVATVTNSFGEVKFLYAGLYEPSHILLKNLIII